MSRKSEHRKAKPHGSKSRLLRDCYAFLTRIASSSRLTDEEKAEAEAIVEMLKAHDAHVDYERVT